MRRTAAILLTVLLLALLAAPAAAAAADEGGGEAVVDRYAAQCVVGGDGQAAVTLTLDMTFSAPVTTLDIPIGAGVDGSVAGLETETVRTDDGAALRITAETGISGVRAFTVTYTVPQAIRETGEGQSLSLELLPPGWQYPMTEAGFAVAMPAAFTEAPVYTGGYYGDLVEDYLLLQSEGNTFSGVFRESLRDHDSLSVTLALPAGYADLGRGGGISGTAALIAVLALGVLGAAYWFGFLRSGGVTVRLRPLPPDGAGTGELPLLAGRGRPSLALQVMQWAALGYLTIFISGKGRIVLRQNMTMGNERRRQERAAFARLFERDARCDGEGVRFGRLAGQYADAAEARWRRRLYAKNSGAPALLKLLAALALGAAALGTASAGLPLGRARIWLLILMTLAGVLCGFAAQAGVRAAAVRDYRRTALLALPAAALLLAWFWGGRLSMGLAVLWQVLAAAATLRGGRRSAAGQENLAQVLGFQRYLRHVSAHQLLLQLKGDSQFFYSMLPFAEAVGQGRAFAAKLDGLELEPCAWLRAPRAAVTTPGFYRQFHDTLRRMEDARKRAR